MRRRTMVILGGLLLAAAGVADADWLKTRDGASIETKGPWRVKGAVVVFTLPNGTLSSLRLSEVDLEASEAATAAAKEPPPPPPPPPAEKAPALVLTNRDVPQAVPVETRDENGEAVAPPPVLAEPVKVTGWSSNESSEIDGTEILGTLRNEGRDIVMAISVTVSLFDNERRPLGSANAFLGASSLAPRTTTTFRALFPDLYSFAGSPEFLVRSQGVQISVPPEPDGEEGEAAGGQGEGGQGEEGGSQSW